MARRNDHSPDELKELILEHTRQALLSEPASQLSLRKVAKSVGYSPGTLINLFGSYSYLLLAANAHTLDELSHRLQHDLEALQQPAQQLQQMALSYLAFARDNPHRWRLVFEHRLAEQEPIPAWQHARINTLFGQVEALLKAINPATTTEARQLAARTLWASVHGICLMALEDKLFAAEGVTGENMLALQVTAFINEWRNQTHTQ